VVRVCSFESPGNGFEAAEPDLEDVYFSTMTGNNGGGRCRQPEVS
jgi:hypothetical protein